MTHSVKKFFEGLIPSSVHVTVEIPSDPKFGHYSTSVAMRMAPQAGKPPLELARSLTEEVRKKDREGFFQKIEAAPPGFINFWLSDATIAKLFAEVLEEGADWGRVKGAGAGIVVIDYSHPNIAKPMSVAHLRSTIIGAALYHIFKFRGWKAIGDNHLGDWGKQFGILIAAYKKAGITHEITICDLLALYVDYTARMKESPALEDEARRETKKLQDGDEENTRIWQRFYDVSLDEFKKIYRLLDVSFDYYLGESFYKEMLPGVIDEALRKGVAERSEGAVIIPITGKAPFVIQKSDEAFLYSTTDIAAVKYRVQKFKPDLILYVVDNGQSLHFEQLFESVKKLGYADKEKLTHVKFGLILSEDMKKLSTRAGRHISLEEVIHEAIQKAKTVVDKKRPDLEESERAAVAETIGIAAIKYNDLSQNRQSDIAFQWEKMLNFEGNSAPYLIYTYARLKSILRKAEKSEDAGDPAMLRGEEDRSLMLKLLQFPEMLENVVATYFPHYLTDYLFNLARAANSFYQHEPVLTAPPAVRAARLRLVEAVATTLHSGLALLGIKTVEKM